MFCPRPGPQSRRDADRECARLFSVLVSVRAPLNSNAASWFLSQCPLLHRTGSQDSIVFVVRADPEPLHSVLFHQAQRTIVQSNSGRPDMADLLEVQRTEIWVLGPGPICL